MSGSIHRRAIPRGCARRRHRLHFVRCVWPSCRPARCSRTPQPATTRRATDCRPPLASASSVPSRAGPDMPCSTWVRPSSMLPSFLSLAFLRDLGRTFVTRLCAVPDLEDRRERVEVDCPPDERSRLAGAVPPMDGSEYVDADWIAARWTDLNRAFADEIHAHRGPVAEWLRARHPSWHVVGKVCLHLAENRGDDAHPFAFLATYAVRAGAGGKVQHRPLARALEESSTRGDRRALLHLLVPLQRAAEPGRVAHGADRLGRHLRGDGVDARRGPPLPARRPGPGGGGAGRTRARLVAPAAPAPARGGRAGRGEEAQRRRHGRAPRLLRRPSRWATRSSRPPRCAELLASHDGLVRLRGQWVELDRERLREVLAHWESVRDEAADGGLSFLEGMRMLAGAARTEDDATAVAAAEGWSRVEAGTWLGRTLEGLRGPGGLAAADPGADLRGTLRPYQKIGVSWLAFASSLRPRRLPRRRHGARQDHPGARAPAPRTSGEGEAARPISSWCRPRCSPTGRRRSTASRPRCEPSRSSLGHACARAGASWERRSRRHRSRHHHLRHAGAPGSWLRAREWSLVILDEAQAIKNPGSTADAGRESAEGARAHRPHRHARREPPRRSLVDLRLPRPRPAGLARGSSPPSPSGWPSAGTTTLCAPAPARPALSSCAGSRPIARSSPTCPTRRR